MKNRPLKRSAIPSAEDQIRFNVFWDHWPKKVARLDAEKAWAALCPDDNLLITILAALMKQKMMPRWTKDKGEFIPNPGTWLRGRRWEDQIEVEIEEIVPLPDTSVRDRIRAAMKPKESSDG